MKKNLKYIFATIVTVATAASITTIAVAGIMTAAISATTATTTTTNTAYAADTTTPPTQIKNPLIIPKPSTLPGNQSEGTEIRSWVINKILPTWTQGMIGFTAALTFLMMVISGFRYLTSYGNEEAATSAKKMLLYSSLGLLLAIFSYAIVSIIINIKFA